MGPHTHKKLYRMIEARKLQPGASKMLTSDVLSSSLPLVKTHTPSKRVQTWSHTTGGALRHPPEHSRYEQHLEGNPKLLTKGLPTAYPDWVQLLGIPTTVIKYKDSQTAYPEWAKLRPLPVFPDHGFEDRATFLNI